LGASFGRRGYEQESDDHSDLALKDPPIQDELEDLALGDDYALKHEFVDMIIDAADRGDGDRVRELLDALHPADVADLMGFLSADYAKRSSRTFRPSPGRDPGRAGR